MRVSELMAKPARSKTSAGKPGKRRAASHKQAQTSSKGAGDKKLFRACLWLAAVVFILDQLSKWAAMEWLTPHVPVPVLPLFNLMLAFNSGAAFSFLSDAGGWQRWLFIALATVISAFLVYWLRQLQAQERWTGIALGLILGGALGNVWDRIFRSGYVVDFIDIYYKSAHWPAFNLADSGICVGVVIIMIQAVHETAGAHKEN